jgi:hypothetical protein
MSDNAMSSTFAIGQSRIVIVDDRGYYFDEDNRVWRNTKTVLADFVEIEK